VILALVYYLLVIYSWLIIARGLLSWRTPRFGTVLYRLQAVLVRVTEPYLALFRRRLRPARLGSVGIDWSFLVALLVLWGVTVLLVRL
jgi:YggT family protein